MDLMEVWMSVVGLSMAVGAIPQGYRLWKRKSSDDIAILPFIILIHGLIWWFIYGLTLGSPSLIITNSICIVIDVTVFAMVIKYRSKK